MVEEEVFPCKKITVKSKLFSNDVIEIQVYNGDEDPTQMNLKRIGIYLYKNNEYIASEWIECGKVVGGFLIGRPDMTEKRKDELTKQAINKMKEKVKELERNAIIEVQKEALKK